MDGRDSVSLFSDTRYAPWWLFIDGWSMLFSSDQLSRFKPPATIPTGRQHRACRARPLSRSSPQLQLLPSGLLASATPLAFTLCSTPLIRRRLSSLNVGHWKDALDTWDGRARSRPPTELRTTMPLVVIGCIY